MQVDEAPPRAGYRKDTRNQEGHKRRKRERLKTEQACESDATQCGDGEGSPGLKPQPAYGISHDYCFRFCGEKNSPRLSSAFLTL